jgi:hypothetical protein
LFQPINGFQDLPMDPDQGRARVAQAAIVFRQAADAGAVSSGERA